jgi:hypothetical protein
MEGDASMCAHKWAREIAAVPENALAALQRRASELTAPDR